MEHPNATLYRRTADAFREVDRAALAALINEDIVWHIHGFGPMAGDIHGLEALYRFFDRLRDVSEGTFTLEEHDVLGTDGRVVALSHMSAVREGIPVSVNIGELLPLSGWTAARGLVPSVGYRRLGSSTRRTCLTRLEHLR